MVSITYSVHGLCTGTECYSFRVSVYTMQLHGVFRFLSKLHHVIQKQGVMYSCRMKSCKLDVFQPKFRHLKPHFELGTLDLSAAHLDPRSTEQIAQSL